MTHYHINADKLITWKSFHEEFKSTFNFPDCYGENMDAWIDCMDEISDEPTHIEISKGHLLKEQAPEILEAILECSAFVNFRKVKQGQKPTLLISISV